MGMPVLVTRFRQLRLARMCAVVTVVTALLLTSCGGSGPSSPNPSTPPLPTATSSQGATPAASTMPVTTTRSLNLTAAGATFPFVLYSKWVSEYNKLNPGIKISYNSIGSGGGKQQFSAQTVDFGASDSVMTDEELAGAKGRAVLQLPATLGAVVLTYHLPGIGKGLRLDPQTITDIVFGRVTKWNDPKIKALNPDLNLPNLDIAFVYRSDGSGTNNIFTDYLSAISAEWKGKVGAGTSVKWPVGIGAKGNEGVAGQVKQLPGSLGYVELAYAVQNKLGYAFIKNKAGNYIEPSFDSVSEAAAGAVIPDDFRAKIVDAAGSGSYPISSFTWLLVYKDNPNSARAQEIARFLWWGVHQGQAFCKDLYYAPLPTSLVQNEEQAILALTSSGQPLFQGGRQ